MIPGTLPTRRQLLLGAGAFAAGGLCTRAAGRFGPALAQPPTAALSGGGLSIELEAAERPQALPCFNGRSLPLWTFSEATPLPVLHVKAGERLHASVRNSLPRAGEHLSIHWHGIRLPNGQDGVPYVTQPPIPPGESFTYDFAPPDAGTFFFHTHCNTAEQLGRGLAGILVVEGDERRPYDAERLVVLRDWAIGEDGALGPFLTDRAARAGTFGSVRGCNDALAPEIAVPAGADIRLRILNVDRTRIMQLGIEGAECAVIAVDGMPVTPFPLKAWFAGPAMRIDVAMRSPERGAATLYDYFAPEPVPLAHFTAEGAVRRRKDFDPAALRPNPLPETDLKNAARRVFTFSATATNAPVGAEAAAEGVPAIFLDDLCTTPQTFWAINKRAWPGRDHSVLPPPVAMLERGRSYVFELRNTTSNMHPIHLHGHSFRWLRSNKRELPVHHADTALLLPRERAEIAFVADNPGDWMFHCHIIEHQETGMMSYIRVT